MSADALDDDWWIEETERSDRKRKKDGGGEGLAKKKRKKRKITDVLLNFEKETQRALHSKSRQYTELHTALQPLIDKLTTVESNEIHLDADSFVSYKQKGNDEILSLDTYLFEVCQNWNKWIDTCIEVPGAPLIIVLTSSSERASELKHQISEFHKDDTTVVRLCAKDKKLIDHVTYITSHVTHIILGTPNRICKLANDKHLKWNHLRHIVIDWYRRDVKYKCMKDIPEIWQDFTSLYLTHLNKLVTNKQCKIGLL